MCVHAVFFDYFLAPDQLIHNSSEFTSVVCFQGTSGTGTLGQTGPTAGVMRTRSSRHTDTHICEPLWKKIQTLLENSSYCASSPSGIDQQKKKYIYIYWLFVYCTWNFVLLYSRWVSVKLYAWWIFCSISGTECLSLIFSYRRVTEVKQCHYLWGTIMQYYFILSDLIQDCTSCSWILFLVTIVSN